MIPMPMDGSSGWSRKRRADRSVLAQEDKGEIG
jgi:hypothetical protein